MANKKTNKKKVVENVNEVVVEKKVEEKKTQAFELRVTINEVKEVFTGNDIETLFKKVKFPEVIKTMTVFHLIRNSDKKEFIKSVKTFVARQYRNNKTAYLLFYRNFINNLG